LGSMDGSTTLRWDRPAQSGVKPDHRRKDLAFCPVS
jgi:hypothetical protein